MYINGSSDGIKSAAYEYVDAWTKFSLGKEDHISKVLLGRDSRVSKSSAHGRG